MMVRFMSIGLVAACVFSADLFAQETSLDEQSEALKQQQKQLETNLRDRWGTMSKDETMAPMRKAIDQANNAYRQTERDDPAINESRQKANTARRDFEKAVWRKANQSELGQQVRTDIGTINEKLDELEAQRRKNDFERREIERELEDTPELRELATKSWQADNAFRDAERNDKGIKEADAAYKAARKAYEEKVKLLPEYIEMEQAKKAVEEAKKNEELRAAQAARELARKAYEEKRDEIRNNDPAMQVIRESREKIDKDYHGLRKDRDTAQNQLRDFARKLEREDEELAPQRNAYNTARKEFDKTRNERTTNQRQAFNDARKAYDQKMRERFRDDNQASQYRTQLDDVRRRIRILDLKKQIRDLESKAEKQPAGGDGVNF